MEFNIKDNDSFKGSSCDRIPRAQSCFQTFSLNALKDPGQPSYCVTFKINCNVVLHANTFIFVLFYFSLLISKI